MSGSRVLITTTAYPPSTGGVQEHVAELASHMDRFEADVVALWLRQRTDWLLGTTLRLDRPSPTGGAANLQTVAWSKSARLRMVPWVLSYYALVPFAARRIAAEMTGPLERLVRPDHVVIHNHRIGREFLALASLALARQRRLPFVLTPHHHPKWRGYRYSGWIEVYRAADAVLALTGAEAAELQRLGVSAERIHVIGGAAGAPMPADGRRFRERIAAPDGPLILFLGQLYEYKGIADIVEAAAALRGRGVPVEVAFVGPETRFSRGFFARNRQPWLHVTGRVDELTKWDALSAATALLLPSQHEAFGRVFLEAWSVGKPVIGGRVPAVSEVISDGDDGLLVTPGSTVDMARAIERVIADPVLAARLGVNGRRMVETRYNWAAVVRRVEDVYAAVAKARAPQS